MAGACFSLAATTRVCMPPSLEILNPTSSLNVNSSRLPIVWVAFPSSSRLQLNQRRVLKITAQVQEAVRPLEGQTRWETRLYVGNIPRTCDNAELAKLFGECGNVEKAEVMYDRYTGRSRRFAFVTMSTVEDAQAAIEKINGTEIGGRVIKVNVTEKPLDIAGSKDQADDANFVDSPHKVYVGNLSKTVDTETLKNKFAEKGNVLDAKVMRIPETGKSCGYGFVSFSSQSEVEAAIASFNNVELQGKRMRVNVA